MLNNKFFQRGSLRELPSGILQKRIVLALSVLTAAIHIYMVVYAFPDPILLRSFHATTFVAFTLFWYSPTKQKTKEVNLFDYVLIALSLSTFAYLLMNVNRIIYRMEFVDQVPFLDFLFGTLFILLVLEAARRALGWPMLIVTIVIFVYTFMGQYLTGYFGHTIIPFKRIIELQFITTLGLFGMITGVSATFVFMFILFGSILRFCGGGDFFFAMGKILGGVTRGGLAKTAVISSAFFSMISGSANANVATTGSFTIPMMKKGGYRPEFAGAVEAAASSAGTITPPVMGAVAFLIAQFVGVPYSRVILIAIVPALIFYISIFLGVDREAIKYNLKGLPIKDRPKLLPTIMQGLPFIIPVIFLVYRIFEGIPTAIAAFESTILIIVCVIVFSAIFPKKNKLKLRNILEAIEDAVKGTVSVSVACTLAGIIIGNIYLTGVGIKFSSLMMSLAHGYLLPGIILAAILTIIFGMGVPVSAAYILAVSLAGPALVESGIPILHAHFFVAWYAALATITPPVCISSYMGASIAKVDDPMKVGWIAVKLAVGGFLVPFLFLYRPELLLAGTFLETVITLVFVIIGIFALSSVIFGNFLLVRYKSYETLLMLISTIMLLWPSYIINLLGLVVFGLVGGNQFLRRKNESIMMANYPEIVD